MRKPGLIFDYDKEKLFRKIRQLKRKVKQRSAREWMIRAGPYLTVCYVANKLSGFYYRLNGSLYERCYIMLNRFSYVFQNPFPSFAARDLKNGLLAGAALGLFLYQRRSNRKKFRIGEEYGSARWGKEQDIEPFIEDEFDDNIILTESESLRIRGNPPDGKYARNCNVEIIGGSGSGKTRFYVKPNLMQMQCSYVVTDPKGTLILESGTMFAAGKEKMDERGKRMRDKKNKLIREPYVIKVFNTIDFESSMHYNPMAYIRSEKDILSFVEMLVTTTTNPESKSGDDFWLNAEKLLYEAYISYIYYEVIEEEQNFSTLLDMINASEVREDDETFKNAIDLIFEELAERKPEHYAVRQYKKYKLAAGKTAKSILISCGARLAPFEIEEVREMTRYDEMELDMMGERKTILYIIISDTDGTFNFLASMMYTQLFNLLCDKALKPYGGKLPIPVRMILDEFANSVTRSTPKTVGITDKSVA